MKQLFIIKALYINETVYVSDVEIGFYNQDVLKFKTSNSKCQAYKTDISEAAEIAQYMRKHPEYSEISIEKS